MKKIEAIIRHCQLQEVIDALIESNFHGLTCTKVQGFGQQHGNTEVYRTTTVHTQFVDKTKIELVTSDIQAQNAIDIIIKHAQTGNVGDGKIFVSDIADAYRIRTGEGGDAAI